MGSAGLGAGVFISIGDAEGEGDWAFAPSAKPVTKTTAIKSLNAKL
jgi:hypothetical protein